MARRETESENGNDTEEQPKEWPQILAVLIAALTSLCSSILFNWPSPTIPVLLSDEYPNIDMEKASYLTVIPPAVTILGAPFYGICLDRYGRKWCLLSAGILYIAAWLCVIFGDNLEIFYVSRALFGFADAAMFGVLPVYIAEVTTPKVRGRWGNLMGFFMYFGQFVMNAIGHYFNMKVSAYIMIALPIIFFVVFLFIPETPYYYLRINKLEEAKESLKKLRRMKNVDKEFEQLSADVKRQLSESGTIMDCIKIKSNRNALLIVALGRLMQQVSGVSAFAVYNQYIFQEAGTSLDKGHSSMIYAAILSIVNFLGLMYTDKLGRTRPMVYSCIGCFIFLSLETIYFFLKDYDVVDVSVISWFPIVGMVLYIIAFSSGLGLIPILLISELFSTSIRSKAATLMTVLFGVYLVIVTKLFETLVSNFGLSAPFCLFAICTFISIFMSYLFIPETKGKTLEEIQQMLKGNDDSKQEGKKEEIEA